MKYLVYLIYILIAIVLITVAISNPQDVTLTLLPEWLGGWSITLPLFVHIYIALFAGLGLGFFFEYLREARYRRQARRAKRALKKTEKQLDKVQKKAGSSEDEVLAIVET